MMKKIIWLSIIILAILIGLYPITYFIIDRKFGLLNTKSNELLANTFWNINFYIHIIFGGIALLIGWIQFNSKFRINNLIRHRQIGKMYLFSVLLSSISGFYIALFATGGIIASLGFILLAALWFFTTLKAYYNIKNKQVLQHQKMMIYSYSFCFAAVTLRIWLPILTLLIGNFTLSYQIVAWLCWIPNLIFAFYVNRKN